MKSTALTMRALRRGLSTQSSAGAYPHALYGLGSAQVERRLLERQTDMLIDDYRSRPAPSEKQLAYAQALAQQTYVEVPDEAFSCRRTCSSFIEECLAAAPPTPRQLAYAQVLSGSVPLPANVPRSRAACSAFIEQRAPSTSAQDATGGAQPSQKQLLYAAQLAGRHRLPLPAEVIQDGRACSSWLESVLDPARRDSMPRQLFGSDDPRSSAFWDAKT